MLSKPRTCVRQLLWSAALAASCTLLPSYGNAETPDLYTRGDVNVDGETDLADAVFTLLHLFASGDTPPCLKSADTNDTGDVDLADAVFLLLHLFQSGEAPSEPYETCGVATSAAGLTCVSFPPCEFETIVTRYDLLTTVAGRGQQDDGGRNNWDDSFEGAEGTAVELSRPHHAIADDAGNIFIADKDAHGIRKLLPDGTLVTVAGTNQPGDAPDTAVPGVAASLRSPNGLWVRGDGTVYILDLGNSKVRRLSPDGMMTTMFKDDEGLVIGRGIWVSPEEDRVFVASGSRVREWTPERGVVTFVEGFAQLGNLIVDPQGQLVVTDRGAHIVARVDSNGGVTRIAGNGTTGGGGDGFPALDTGLNGVRAIWFLDTGAYFLGTHRGSQVWYVDTRGVIHLFLDGRSDDTHAGDGESFWTPGPKVSEVRSVSVDSRGNLIVTENDLGFVRVVQRVDRRDT